MTEDRLLFLSGVLLGAVGVTGFFWWLGRREIATMTAHEPGDLHLSFPSDD